MSATFPIAITGRFRNWYLWRGVQACGSQKALAERLGISQGRVGDFINLKRQPGEALLTSDRFRAAVLEVTGEPVDTVFPAALQEIHRRGIKAFCVKRNVDLRLLEAYSHRALPEWDPAHALSARERREMVQDALAHLPPMQRRVITARFGLDDGGTRTLAETATILQLSTERVRQIEGAALRGLATNPGLRAQLEGGVSAL